MYATQAALRWGHGLWTLNGGGVGGGGEGGGGGWGGVAGEVKRQGGDSEVWRGPGQDERCGFTP